MAAVGPAKERIQQRLHDAVERLRHDMDEVEFWTEVLSSLTRPVPDYGTGTTVLNRFALPHRSSDDSPDRGGENAQIRRPGNHSNNGRSRH